MNRIIEKTISIVIEICTLGFVGIYRSTHIDMTKKYNTVLHKATFKAFKEKFNSVQWFAHIYPDSLFSDEDEKNYLHASIYRLDGVGYLMTTYGYIRASRLIRKKVKKINGKNHIYV